MPSPLVPGSGALFSADPRTCWAVTMPISDTESYSKMLWLPVPHAREVKRDLSADANVPDEGSPAGHVIANAAHSDVVVADRSLR